MTAPLEPQPLEPQPPTTPGSAVEIAEPTAGFRSWARRAEIDRAVVFAATSRVWILLAAPITFILIARELTAVEQGFYFTFASLLALQTFVELGFYNVIVSVASHEWAHLELDEDGRITGDPDARSRLVSLGRLVFKWYAVAAALFVAVVGVAGYAFLSHGADAGVAWRGPWFALVIFTGFLLWTLPFISLLEGCNEVEVVNRFRTSQVIIASLALWITVLAGGGLWAAAVGVAVNAVRDVYLIVRRYRNFFAAFLTPPAGPTISWRQEILPMQWRIGISGTVNYFANYLLTPVMFAAQGPVVAGRMGLTVAAVNGLQNVSAAWMQTKSARFGMLVARRSWEALDGMFRRALGATTVALFAGALCFLAAIVLLNVADVPIADRALSPFPTAMLLVAALLGHISFSQSTYLRAHKREPMVVVSVASSLAIGAAVWLLGSRYGPSGAAAGYLAVWVIAVVWGHTIWRRCRLAWHGDGAATS